MFKCPCGSDFENKESFKTHFSKCQEFRNHIDKFGYSLTSKVKAQIKDYILQEGMYDPRSIEGEDYVVCPYCVKEGKKLTRAKTLVSTHFKLHSKTTEQVRNEYPNIQLKCMSSQNKAKKTNIEKYGVENPFQTEKVKEIVKGRTSEQQKARVEKQKKTVQEKYGVDNVFKTEKVKNIVRNRDDEWYQNRQKKTIQTNIEKYGAEHYMQTEEGKEKLREAFIENYDVKNPMQVGEIVNKMIEANKDNHNGLFNSSTSVWRQKIVRAWKNKPKEELNSILNKRKETLLKRYGVENISLLDSIKSKIRASLLENCGTDVAYNFNSLAGYRADLDHFFRSSWEANYARICDYTGFAWIYEPETFSLTIPKRKEVRNKKGEKIVYKEGDTISYTPDFYIGNEIIEVKGTMDELSRLKINLFKEQALPKNKILKIIDKSVYQKLTTEYSSVIPFWESYNFNIKTDPQFFGVLDPSEVLPEYLYRPKNFNKLSKEDQQELVNQITQFYQNNGFPHVEYQEQFVNQVKQIKKKNCNFTKHGVFVTNIKTSLIYHFQPHIWNSYTKGKLSPFDFWESKLSELVRNRLKYSNVLSKANMRLGLRIITKAPTNFNPVLAKNLIEKYGGDECTVYDFCAGWGGRLLGAATAENCVKYIGNDVSFQSITGNNRIYKWLVNKGLTNINVDLYNESSEIFNLGDKVDFVFTCPPYFDKEIYEDNESQSTAKYPTYEIWFEKYLIASLRNAFKTLKPGGYLCLAYQNDQYETLKQIKSTFSEIFIEEIRIYTKRFGDHVSTESILVFQQEKKT